MLLFPIKLFVILIWTVVGFFLWIPLLIRSIAVYTISIMGAVIARGPTKGVGRILSDATTFYSSGFRRIWESFDETTENPTEGIRLGTVVGECVWAILVWGSMLFFGLGMHRVPLSDLNRFYFDRLPAASRPVSPARQNVSDERHFLVVIRNNTSIERLTYFLHPEKDDQSEQHFIKAQGVSNSVVRRTDPGLFYDSSTEPGYQRRSYKLRAVEIVGRRPTDKDWAQAPMYTFRMANATEIGLYADTRGY